MPRLPHDHPANDLPATPDQKNFILKYKMAPVSVVLRLTYREAQRIMSGGGVPVEPPVPNQPKKPVPAVQLEKGGLHLIGTRVFRLHMGGSGLLYAKVLTELEIPRVASNGVRRFRWEFAKGVMRSIRPENRLTKEQAEAFGRRFSCCVRCGIELDPNITDRDGNRRYIGPICEKKMGWS
jgi:hypothetical protein